MEALDYENITPRALKSRLNAGERPVLLDVREPWEFELARIEGSVLIPMSETVVICHHGNRSSYVAMALQRAGFESVLNLEGGLDAYSSVDEAVPRY
jgi:rhodanese-related sulfurtransferase